MGRAEGIPCGAHRVSKVREVGMRMVFWGNREAIYLTAVKVSLIEYGNMVHGRP